jgi:hypothetical protein
VSAHNRHVRFRLPEPVLASADREQTAGTWMSDDTPETSVMMQVPDIGSFVRCLLPVKLTGGFTITFGVWLAVHPDDLQRAFREWWEPRYANLRLDGWLANRLPTWDCLAGRAHASVKNADQTPYLTSSPEPLLASVLGDDWPHDEVLAALPE